MCKKNAHDIKKIISEQNIKFLRLQFVDIFGTMKNICTTTDEIDKILNNEMMFDGSSIQGFVRIEESDMYLHPDLSTFTILPWFKENKIARLICDIYRPNGNEFSGDPRYVLKRAIKNANNLGYEFCVGPECEFFIFNIDDENNIKPVTHDKASYFDLAPIDNGELARIDMVNNLIKMGFKIEGAHHENAPGQHEIDFRYSDALNSADNIITFKLVVKTIAKKFNLHATFMPKPINNECGSGMHCNMSLFKNGANAFYDANDKNNLSKEAYYFIGGLIEHAKAISAITNPTINSYKRLIPGYEAPIHIAWSTSNRSPLIRVPAARGQATRLELRNPDPSCNPYLALAVMLNAGLDGIKNKINPPKAIDKNIYAMNPDDLTNSKIDTLPKNLIEAIDELMKDELIKETLGAHVLNNFVKAKKIEWQNYISTVHQWEIDKYLIMY